MKRRPLGAWLAPLRFVLFVGVLLVATPVAILCTDWSRGMMLGFDAAGIAFLLSMHGLLRDADAPAMRRSAAHNDANRLLLLGIASSAMFAVLAAVAVELGGEGRPDAATLALVVATLAIAWLFGNMIYALHYAHLYYVQANSGDTKGLAFPQTEEPLYWDFIYFAFTLGMTFQTSDVAIAGTGLRRIVTLHAVVAFIFNLGIVAFTINVLGGR